MWHRSSALPFTSFILYFLSSLHPMTNHRAAVAVDSSTSCNNTTCTWCVASPLTCCSSSLVNWWSASCCGWWSPPWRPPSLLQMLRSCMSSFSSSRRPARQLRNRCHVAPHDPLGVRPSRSLQLSLSRYCVIQCVSALEVLLAELTWIAPADSVPPSPPRSNLPLSPPHADYSGLSGCSIFFSEERQRLFCVCEFVRGGGQKRLFETQCVLLSRLGRGGKSIVHAWKSPFFCRLAEYHMSDPGGGMEDDGGRGREGVGYIIIQPHLLSWLPVVLWSLTVFQANTHSLFDNNPSHVCPNSLNPSLF